jgi:hypothetical protein
MLIKVKERIKTFNITDEADILLTLYSIYDNADNL